jgi:NAD(P)-dependent dehydrogenase (short-subunit alcohol dehydrogenase family)
MRRCPAVTEAAETRPGGELLDGKHAVVTGTGDIGRAIIEALRTHGAWVTVWDRDRESVARAAASAPDTIIGDVVDITVATSVAAGAGRAIERGAVDVLVNSAGILGRMATVVDMDEAEWRRVLDVNLTGSFLVCRAFLPHMIDRRAGSIVNIASTAGQTGEPELAAYSASKFGVIGLTQSIADEVGPLGVRANCVCPGAVASTMHAQVVETVAGRLGTSADALDEDVVSRTALRGLVSPTDVANAVLFLASDLSSFVTRETIAVSGGLRG